MSTAARAKPGRILVVEDDSDILEVMKLMLEDEGHHVAMAKDGRAGLAAATGGGKPFDLVVLDISMPDMSGIEVATALRAHPKTADVYIAIHTGLDEHWVRERFDRYDVFLTKAEDADVLVDELARLLAEPARPGRHHGVAAGETTFSLDEVETARRALRQAMALGPETVVASELATRLAAEIEQLRKLGRSSGEIAAVLAAALGRPVAASLLEPRPPRGAPRPGRA